MVVLGVMLHAIGGFAAGSFYAPIKKVRGWAWESSWLILGIAAWLVAPWFVAYITTPNLMQVLGESDGKDLGLTCMFGLLWGIGGLTYGLALRYLGIALGGTVALAFCMLGGTLVPPMFKEGGYAEMAGSASGKAVFVGLAICLVGIILCGLAGVRKERELQGDRTAGNQEFRLGWGLAVATFSGIMSSCFAFGFAAGEPIAKLSQANGTDSLFQNNAVLVVILLGGFVTNAVWCLALNARNKTFGDYTKGPRSGQLKNYLLSALGGIVWYGQFFFYGMGETKLGDDYKFSSWSIHMAFIIVFTNLWGLYFREWRGTSPRTRLLVWLGIATLVGSTVVIAYGKNLA